MFAFLNSTNPITFRENVERVLHVTAYGPTYSEDTNAEDDERYNDPIRVQSAFRTFQDYCTLDFHLQGIQVKAYNLSGKELPRDSKWALAVNEIVVEDISLPTLADTIPHPKVLYMYISRLWRNLHRQARKVFYAVSTIRTLAVASRWVEHTWEYDHVDGEEILRGNMDPIVASTFTQRFGQCTLTGPLGGDPEWWHEESEYFIDIPGWEIPIRYNDTEVTWSLEDRYHRVCFAISFGTSNPHEPWQAIRGLLELTH